MSVLRKIWEFIKRVPKWLLCLVVLLPPLAWWVVKRFSLSPDKPARPAPLSPAEGEEKKEAAKKEARDRLNEIAKKVLDDKKRIDNKFGAD